MFTLGIFTTHIPYIALVVFYAFFWLFGVNHASAGESHPKEKVVAIKQPANIMVAAYDCRNSIDIRSLLDTNFLTPESKNAFHLPEKLIHNEFYIEENSAFSYFALLFCRPPPIAF